MRGEWNSFQVPFGYALLLFLSRLFDAILQSGTQQSTGQIKKTTKACPIKVSFFFLSLIGHFNHVIMLCNSKMKILSGPKMSNV